MGQDPHEIARRTAVGLAALKQLLAEDPANDENPVALFVTHHLDEIEPEYWTEQTGTATPTPAQVLELLVLRNHWGVDDEDEIDDDGLEMFDYTLPAEKTDYVLSVRFDEEGQVYDIDMES